MTDLVTISTFVVSNSRQPENNLRDVRKDSSKGACVLLASQLFR